MADVELTEEEFKAKLDEAKGEALSSLVDGTSWKDAEALKESALNADKKISEKGGEVKTLQEKLDEAEKKNEELAAKIKSEPPKGDDKPKPEEVINSLSKEEAEILDQAIAKNPKLGKKIADGGVEAQAEAITTLRESIPKETPKDFFSSMLTKNASGSKKLDEDSIAGLLSKEFDKNRKKTLTPASAGNGGTVASSSDTDDTPRVRGGGGMAELAAESRE